MNLPKAILEEYRYLNDRSIVVAYRGSIAHGMYQPNELNSIDDKDVMAVCVPNLTHYFGLREFGSHGTVEVKKDEWDIVAYEARKFIRLLAQGNPNVMSILWLEPQFYLKVSRAFGLLLEHRELFVGRHVYKSFSGYAHGQEHRMTHPAFEGYMGAKRREKYEKFGFDCKNAAHLIRLLRMCIEFLKDGQFYVKRSDSSQLLEIKRGEWSLGRVQAEAARLFDLADKAYLESNLPVSPNLNEINDLSVLVIRTALEEFGE